MIKKLFPILGWLPKYTRNDFKHDFISGITTGVMIIPQGLAYAMIAGLPPIFGLYAALSPQVVYAFMGTSRQLSVGPVAMDSLLVAAGLGALSLSGIEEYILMALFLSLVMGAIQLLLGILRLGILVNYLSRPVISGFTSAAAVIIATSQIKHLLGLKIESDNQLHLIIINLVQNINESNLIALIVGGSSIGLILVSKHFDPRLPASLITVIFGILLVRLTRWDLHGVDIVGAIPKGLPHFRVPTIDPYLFNDILPIAIALALIAYMEAISVAKSIEEKSNSDNIRPNQELIALGSSNIIGAFFQAYPTTGSFSRTAINYQSKAKSSISSLISALLVGLTLLFFTPLLFYLPKAVLAAIIMVAIVNLIDTFYPKKLFQHRKDEFFLLIVTFVITLFLGIVEGIVLGVLLSLLIMVIRTSKPHYAVLGKVKDTQYYKNIDRYEVVSRSDLLIVRFDAQLFFGNRDYFKKIIYREIQKKVPKVKGFILVARGITYIDSSALFTLNMMVDRLNSQGVRFMVAGAIGPARDILFRGNIMQIIGAHNFFLKTSDAVDNFDGKKAMSPLQEKLSQQNNL